MSKWSCVCVCESGEGQSAGAHLWARRRTLRGRAARESPRGDGARVLPRARSLSLSFHTTHKEVHTTSRGNITLRSRQQQPSNATLKPLLITPHPSPSSSAFLIMGGTDESPFRRDCLSGRVRERERERAGSRRRRGTRARARPPRLSGRPPPSRRLRRFDMLTRRLPRNRTETPTGRASHRRQQWYRP